MRAIFSTPARKHSALSTDAPSLPDLSGLLSQASARQSRTGSGFKEWLLFAVYLFGITLWIVCAWTMWIGWVALGVVVVATLTAGIMWRRAVPPWLAFTVMALWGDLPFAWRSIGPEFSVPRGFWDFVRAFLSQIRSLLPSVVSDR
jgi:hypothetical protein